MKTYTRQTILRRVFIGWVIFQFFSLSSLELIKPAQALQMQYFPMSPGSFLVYQSNNSIESWLTKRYVDEEWEFLGGPVFGTFTIHWCEARQRPNEPNFSWVNQMWISKTANTIMWHGFADEKSKVMAARPLAYVTEPVVEGAVHQGQTTVTLKNKATGESMSNLPFEATYTIDAIETVSTPAGTFEKCIKVHEEEVTPDGDVSFWVWYAPNIGAVKYYYPQQKDRVDILLNYQVDLTNDPWDSWMMPKVPLLIQITLISVIGLIAVIIIVKIKKRHSK